MFNKKGQSTLEYALITAVVIAGLLLMQHYMKRGYAGKLKSSTDDIGEQYDPSKFSASYTIDNNSATHQVLANKALTQTYTDTGDGTGRLQHKQSTANETTTAYTADESLYSK